MVLLLGLLSWAPMQITARSFPTLPGLLTSLVGLAACAGTPVTPANESPALASNPSVHALTGSAQGILVNAYWVESEHGIVLVDSALTVADASALRQRLDAVGKPLLAVLLTHGHPDHYNGVAAVIAGRGDVPVYATEDVSQVIRQYDAAKEAQWRPMFGEQWPAPRAFPDHELKDADELTVDGLRWTVHSVGPGESHADSYWSLEATPRHIFLGDVVMHGVHAYLSDGHSTRWLDNLARLGPELGEESVLHPGHGESGGPELLAWQKAYLEAYRAAVESLRAGRPTLDEPGEQALSAMMKSKYPQAALDFLVPLGADAVASELAAGP